MDDLEYSASPMVCDVLLAIAQIGLFDEVKTPLQLEPIGADELERLVSNPPGLLAMRFRSTSEIVTSQLPPMIWIVIEPDRLGEEIRLIRDLRRETIRKLSEAFEPPSKGPQTEPTDQG